MSRLRFLPAILAVSVCIARCQVTPPASKNDAGQEVFAPDVFAGALRDDLNPDQTIREARQTLDQIGDRFDSGEYDRLTPSAFSAMSLVALAWSRLGWAKFLQGETLDAIQFLSSAWLLSQSGVVADRLGRVYEKEGQKEKARHFYALATAAGGPEAQSAREQTTRLSTSPDAAALEIAQASAELPEMRTVKIPAAAGNTGSAQFALVFDIPANPRGRNSWRATAPCAPQPRKFAKKSSWFDSRKFLRLSSCVTHSCRVQKPAAPLHCNPSRLWRDRLRRRRRNLLARRRPRRPRVCGLPPNP